MPRPDEVTGTDRAIDSRARYSRAELWLLAVWVPIASVVQLVRMTGQRPWRALIAEDGRIFLGDAMRDPVGSLVAGYNGYFQLVCRAMGTAATLFPMQDAAVVFAVGGAVVASLVSVYVYVASTAALDKRWTRALVAVLTVLTPAAVFEISGTGLELHWYFLFACFWTLWETSDTGRGRTVADTLVAGITAWSAPLAVLYAPLALRRALAGRGRRRWFVLAAWSSGVVAQTAYVLTHERPERFSGLYLPDIPVVFIQRVVGGAFVGAQHLRSLWFALGWALVALLAVAAVAVCVYGIVVATGRRGFVFSAAVYSVILTIASLVVRGTVEVRWPPHQTTEAGSRYFFVPILLLAAAAIALADSAGARQWLRTLPAVVVAAVIFINPTPKTARGGAPQWRDSLRVALNECRYKGEELHVTIAPLSGDWYVPVICDRRRKQSPIGS